MTLPEIHDVVDLFAQAAERMRRAGLDGTELNGACNHLLNSFLSRAWNTRVDEYGPQTIENRTRLFVQIIREIKRRNGSEWPIIALFNGMEPDLADGITISESTQFAQAFEAAGADAMEVRSEFYTWTDNPARRDSTHFPDVYFYPDRPPLADPLAPGKVLQNRPDDIRPCITCMTRFDRGEHFLPVVCRVNAALGWEPEYAVSPGRGRAPRGPRHPRNPQRHGAHRRAPAPEPAGPAGVRRLRARCAGHR